MKRKHLKFEEKKLLLKYHFESGMDLDKLSIEFLTSGHRFLFEEEIEYFFA